MYCQVLIQLGIKKRSFSIYAAIRFNNKAKKGD